MSSPNLTRVFAYPQSDGTETIITAYANSKQIPGVPAGSLKAWAAANHVPWIDSRHIDGIDVEVTKAEGLLNNMKRLAKS